MIGSPEAEEPQKQLEIPSEEMTVEVLMKKHGFSKAQAELLLQLKELYSGAQRKVDETLLKMVQQAEDALSQSGLSLKQQTEVQYKEKDNLPRKFYGPHWQMPSEFYAPRGKRGQEIDIKGINVSFLLNKVNAKK